MNTSLFFLVTVSLGGMAGMSGSHYLHTSEMVQRYENGSGNYITPDFMRLDNGGVTQIELDALKLKQTSSSLANSVDLSIDDSANETTENVRASTSDNNADKTKLTSPADATYARESQSRDKREEQLIELLKMMRADQKLLKEQLAETNGELAKANFRLDTQSDSFKPLRTVSERARSLEVTSDDDDFHQLLPPK